MSAFITNAELRIEAERLCDENDRLKAENARLRDELVRENAEYRELIRDMWTCISECENGDCTWCTRLSVCDGGICEFSDRMDALGIEVPEWKRPEDRTRPASDPIAVLRDIDQLRRDLSGYHGQLKAHNDLQRHCDNQRKRISELEGLYADAKAENAKVRELVHAVWRCIHTGVNCSDCRLIAGGCTLQSAMRELGIEVD